MKYEKLEFPLSHKGSVNLFLVFCDNEKRLSFGVNLPQKCMSNKEVFLQIIKDLALTLHKKANENPKNPKPNN